MINKGENIKLEHPKGENPFQVPENYFEGFESKLMDKINNKQDNFKVPMHKMIKPYLYIAASFLLLFTIGKVTLNGFKADPSNLASNELTIDQEMELIYSEVDDFTITDYLLENDILLDDLTEE